MCSMHQTQCHQMICSSNNFGCTYLVEHIMETTVQQVHYHDAKQINGKAQDNIKHEINNKKMQYMGETYGVNCK